MLRYHPGDFFGERAILNHDRRAATVIATHQLKVLGLRSFSFPSGWVTEMLL